MAKKYSTVIKFEEIVENKVNSERKYFKELETSTNHSEWSTIVLMLDAISLFLITALLRLGME